jgi:hypothetical protein
MCSVILYSDTIEWQQNQKTNFHRDNVIYSAYTLNALFSHMSKRLVTINRIVVHLFIVKSVSVDVK